MKKKIVFKEYESIKDLGKGHKFRLDNPREGGGASWEIQEIRLVEVFEKT